MTPSTAVNYWIKVKINSRKNPSKLINNIKEAHDNKKPSLFRQQVSWLLRITPTIHKPEL
jgi:hypothetical protein